MNERSVYGIDTCIAGSLLRSPAYAIVLIRSRIQSLEVGFRKLKNVPE